MGESTEGTEKQERMEKSIKKKVENLSKKFRFST
jgi:hypothetical protein